MTELAVVVVGERQQAVLCREDAFLAQASGKWMLAVADVFVEGLRPGVVARADFGERPPPVGSTGHPFASCACRAVLHLLTRAAWR